MNSSAPSPTPLPAFSWKRFKSALDERIIGAKEPLEFIYRNRFWFWLVSAVTFVLPVLENQNTASISWARSASLLGFDILVPVCTRANIYSGYVASRSISIHPLGLLIYVPLGVLLYLAFVRQPIPLRWEFRHAVLQTIATLLLPFAHIVLLTMVMPGFRSEWHSQSPLIGYWVLLACAIVLLAATYHELIKPKQSTI